MSGTAQSQAGHSGAGDTWAGDFGAGGIGGTVQSQPLTRLGNTAGWLGCAAVRIVSRVASVGLVVMALVASVGLPLTPRLPAPLAAPRTVYADALTAPLDAPLDVLSAEAQLLTLLNADRAASGLAPLAADGSLAEIARWRSEDMAARGYFSHDIGGFYVFQVIKDRGIRYQTAGENLAFNTYDLDRSVSQAEQQLMASPTHRDNILKAEYTHVGIGVAQGPDGRTIYTQLFMRPLSGN